MHSSTVLFLTILGIGSFHLFQASPIGHVGFSSIEVTTPPEIIAVGATELTISSALETTEAPRPVLNETAAIIDTLTDGSSNETHIRQKRSCGCCGGGCCCCRP